MRQRDLESIRQFRREEEEYEAKQREERERPIRDAEQQYNETARKLHAVQRERVLTQKDDEFRLDMSTTTPIPTEQVPGWQRRQADEFKATHPDYWPTPRNEAILVDYINRNHPGIRLVSALQLGQAYQRLKEFGLLQERPGPELVAEPSPIPEPEQQRPAEPQRYEGIDPLTGLNRQYTAREVERMSSDEYRRCFSLYGDRKPIFIDPRFT